jgi:hypothetical protein
MMETNLLVVLPELLKCAPNESTWLSVGIINNHIEPHASILRKQAIALYRGISCYSDFTPVRSGFFESPR